MQISLLVVFRWAFARFPSVFSFFGPGFFIDCGRYFYRRKELTNGAECSDKRPPRGSEQEKMPWPIKGVF